MIFLSKSVLKLCLIRDTKLDMRQEIGLQKSNIDPNGPRAKSELSTAIKIHTDAGQLISI